MAATAHCTSSAPSRRARRLALASALASLVLGGGRHALASEPPEGDDAASPSAAELFRAGQAEAAAADYDGAIEHFEAAMKQVAHDPEAVGIRNRMRTELVIAHLRAHGIDGDAAHLSKASLLLDDYEHDLEPGQTEEREWVAQRRAEIETRREQARAAAERAAAEQRAADASRPADAAVTPDPAAVEPTPPPAAPPPARDAGPGDNGAARTLMVTGGVVTGVGVVGGVLAVAGFAMANAAVDTFETEPNRRDDARTQNRTGNAMGIAGGVVAGLAIPTGVALLVVGAKRRRATQTAVVPYAAPAPGGGGQAGLWLHGAF